VRRPWLAVALAVLAGISALAPRLAPARDLAAWSTVLAGESDTTIFITKDGLLLKARFDLAAAETLWAPERGEKLSRLTVSPDGRKVAWLSRSGDQDLTHLWLGATRQGSPRVRFRSLKPQVVGRLHFEPVMPSTHDDGITGARLIVPTQEALRPTSSTLQWMPDASGLAFGYDDGLAYLPADSGAAVDVSKAWIVDLLELDPSTVFLADLIAVVDDQRVEGWHLVYPTAMRWRVFPAAGMTPDSPRTASSTTVWWALGKTIRAVHSHDPTPHTFVEAHDPVTWLRYLPDSHAVVWTAGTELRSTPEDGGPDSLLERFKSPIRRVLESADRGLVGFVAGDSLALFRPAGGGTAVVRLSGLDPDALFEHDSSVVLVDRDKSGSAALARWTPGHPIAPIDAPHLHGATFFASPSGARIVAAELGHKVPSKLVIFDLATDAFTEVANPGIVGWEPFRPR